MGWKPIDNEPLRLNGAFFVNTTIMRFVVASAAEAELGALKHHTIIIAGRVDSLTDDFSSIVRNLFSSGQHGPAWTVLSEYWKDADVLETCCFFENNYEIFYFFHNQ